MRGCGDANAMYASMKRNADGLWNPALQEARPLSLFDGPRVDFSLARLTHYTGAPAEHVQQYILFTNYHRYVDAFVKWACEQLQDPASGYTQLSCAGGVVVGPETAAPERAVAESTRIQAATCANASG